MGVKAALDGLISEDILRFAKQHGIVDHVAKAVKAAQDVYADAESITAALKQDPEFGDWHVNVLVVLPDDQSPETEPEKYYECLGKWAPFVPPQLGGLIRLSTSWSA